MTGELPSPDEYLDRAAIREVLEAWVIHRDDGEWDRLLALYTADATMITGASSGSARDFVNFSRRLAEAGVFKSQHFIGAGVIELNGDRAVAMTRVLVLLRGFVHGVEVDVTVYARFFDRLKRTPVGWLIQQRSPIYEKDRMDPVDPGEPLELDPVALAAYPEGYRHMAYFNNSQGGPASPTDLATTAAAGVAAAWADARLWLGESA